MLDQTLGPTALRAACGVNREVGSCLAVKICI